MDLNIGNTFLCMNKNCLNQTACVNDLLHIQQHSEHKLIKIQTLSDQLEDPKHPLNLFNSLKREEIMIDIDAKIQELSAFSTKLIDKFEQQMRKFVNDTMYSYDNSLFLLKAVINLEPLIISDKSKDISKLFYLAQNEIELKINEVAYVKSIVNKTTETLNEQISKLFQMVDFGRQKFRWSQKLKNNNIQINNKNATIVKDNKRSIILIEPMIDFNSKQSCRVKFSGAKSYSIRFVDFNVQIDKDPDYIGLNRYGSYDLYNHGDVWQDDKKQPQSFQFYEKDLIEMSWDGTRKIFGIQKIGTNEKYEIKVVFNEHSKLFFAIQLDNGSCQFI